MREPTCSLRMSGENAGQRLGRLFKLTMREGRKSFFPEKPAPSCADPGANPPSKFDVSLYLRLSNQPSGKSFVQYSSRKTGVDESCSVSIFNLSTLPLPAQTERHLKYHAKYYFKPDVAEAHVRMVVSLPCDIQKCTKHVKLTLKNAVATVAGVGLELVSIDFVHDTSSPTKIEVCIRSKPGVQAEEICSKLTEPGIRTEIAGQKFTDNKLVMDSVGNISVVEAAAFKPEGTCNIEQPMRSLGTLSWCV